MLAPTSTVTPPVPSIASSSSTATTTASLASDFETFIKMLTAQAQYQDPLEPIDSTEYASQLAQFSMVEQQVLSNDLLDALASQLGGGSIGQLASWIGMEARTTAPVQFNGTPLTIATQPNTGADESYLIVKNQQGQQVQRLAVPTGQTQVDWAGVQDNGTPFAQGQYTFELESRARGEVLATNAAPAYARVTEARVDNNQTVLILEGGASITATDVTGLREAG
jgi:flagellar basal-body rod modification protein FlgD